MKENKFIKNASWMVIGRVIQMALTFITTFLIARYLGPSKYGSIAYTFTYVAFFVQVCALGTNEVLVKELLDKKERNNEIVGTMIIFRLLASFISIGLIYIISFVLYHNRTLIILSIIQSFSLIFQAFECIIYFYQSRLLANKTALINIIAYSLTSIFRILGLIINRDVKWFAFAVSLDYLVIAVLLVIIYFKDGNKLSFSITIGKDILKNSWHYLFANILIAIYSQADKFLLGKILGEESVGYYSAATQLCNAWPFVLVAIIDSARPIIIELFNEDKNKYYKRIKQLYASIFYIGVLVALIFTIFSDLIIKIIYGLDYMDSSLVLKIASWNTIFAYFGVSRTIWMQCEDKLKYEKTLALIGAIVNVILNYVLIKTVGLIGAAISLTLTQIITNLISVYIIKETRENAILLIDAIRLKGVLKD